MPKWKCRRVGKGESLKPRKFCGRHILIIPGVAPGRRDGEDAVLAVVARHPLRLDAGRQSELLLEQLRPRPALLLDLL